jgi:alkanesulfonate monooxygenase SsuD/methylene tetrahydromethanopterin reductase-like flavin-dependent oxidoreductase (luciferase family)
VAEHADASNFGAHAAVGGAFTEDGITRKFEALRAHCDAAGRAYDAVLRTHWACPVVVGRTPQDVERQLATVQDRLRTQYASSAIIGMPEEVISRFQALVAAGMQYFITYVAPGDSETLRLLAEEVFPAVRPR